MSGVHDFFDHSDARDVERADDFAERTQVRRRRNADTYGEQKRWRDVLLDRLDADEKVVR